MDWNEFTGLHASYRKQIETVQERLFEKVDKFYPDLLTVGGIPERIMGFGEALSTRKKMIASICAYLKKASIDSEEFKKVLRGIKQEVKIVDITQGPALEERLRGAMVNAVFLRAIRLLCGVIIHGINKLTMNEIVTTVLMRDNETLRSPWLDMGSKKWYIVDKWGIERGHDVTESFINFVRTINNDAVNIIVGSSGEAYKDSRSLSTTFSKCVGTPFKTAQKIIMRYRMSMEPDDNFILEDTVVSDPDQTLVLVNDVLPRRESSYLEKMCVICLEVESRVMFRPCNHLICCKFCGESVSKCPVCRESILSTIEFPLMPSV